MVGENQKYEICTKHNSTIRTIILFVYQLTLIIHEKSIFQIRNILLQSNQV